MTWADLGNLVGGERSSFLRVVDVKSIGMSSDHILRSLKELRLDVKEISSGSPILRNRVKIGKRD